MVNKVVNFPLLWDATLESAALFPRDLLLYILHANRHIYFDSFSRQTFTSQIWTMTAPVGWNQFIRPRPNKVVNLKPRQTVLRRTTAMDLSICTTWNWILTLKRFDLFIRCPFTCTAIPFICGLKEITFVIHVMVIFHVMGL